MLFNLDILGFAVQSTYSKTLHSLLSIEGESYHMYLLQAKPNYMACITLAPFIPAAVSPIRLPGHCIPFRTYVSEGS